MYTKKKITLALSIGIGFTLLFAFKPSPPPMPHPYEQEPPYAEYFKVKKLVTPLGTGENLLMKVKFYDEFTTPSTLDIYYGDGNMVTFYDDGTNGDVTADDNEFAAYIEEDLAAFVNKVEAWEAVLVSDGKYLEFTGHRGELQTAIPTFDETGFNNNTEVTLSTKLINGANCGSAILKQNSLFITDLSVVEDLARTYNLKTNQGNINGVWTFGSMMKNMAGSSVDVSDFMKAWIVNYITTPTVNGEVVPKRGEALGMLITPWLRAAYNNCSLSVDTGNWESLWDSANEDSLIGHAPFKLMAIVNRFDIRGNSSFSPTITNAGETRFIFTLISPCGNINLYDTAGMPPRIENQDFGYNDLLDWQGMNVIFEYGNVQTTHCEMRDLAQAWLDLSAYSLPDPDFNDALEVITETVTKLNSAPNKTNQSAINRIRTNERVLQSAERNNASWASCDWEFRQFELDGGNGMWEQVPLTNTPKDYTNATNTISSSYIDFGNNHNPGATYLDSQTAANLLDWVYMPSLIHKQRILNDNYDIPATYPTSSDYLLAGAGRMIGEYLHNYDLNWYTALTSNYNQNIIVGTPPFNEQERNIRRSISINTCQGCHGGETKTTFTQVLPRGYGQSANYWGATHDFELREIDVRLFNIKGGAESDIGYDGINPAPNYPLPTGKNHYPIVSGFLTGRNCTGKIGNHIHDDDFDNTLDNPTDNLPVNQSSARFSLFYVLDPTNHNTSPKVLPEKRWGFNDLERRRKDLCAYLNANNCSISNSSVIPILHNVIRKPFGKAPH